MNKVEAIIRTQAKESFKRLNPHLFNNTHNEIKNSKFKNNGSVAKLESNSCHGSLEKKKIQADARFIIRIESVRKRLLDTDNICCKFLVDLLRYSKIIPDDNPEQTKIQATQRKCLNGEDEHTIVQIDMIC